MSALHLTTSIVKTMYPSVKKIVIRVKYFCNFIITEKPSTPPIKVSDTAMTNPIIIAIFRSTLPIRSNTVPVAKVASDTKTVSQPTSNKYVKAPGNTLPFTPKAARERTIVVALDFFPAKELKPTSKKESTVPAIAAKVACQNEIPNPKKKEPYESASKETFAPHQGQNKSRALPRRSFSAIRFVEFNSYFGTITLPYF